MIRTALLVVFPIVLIVDPALATVSMNWVLVGNPGNPADTATNCFAAACGSIPYRYRISKYEVTNDQYAEFLNAKAASDPLGLYHFAMASDAVLGGITQNGVSGSFTYTVKPGFANKPVTYISFFDALRFANWLNNGQGTASTETGAYTLTGGTETPSNGTTVTRNPTAVIFLPSENEWYKAAYFNGTSYFDYPAGTDTQTVCAAATSNPNSANCGLTNFGVTPVGSFTGSASPYGTFDQGGNVFEWNEQIVSGTNRGIRGGDVYNAAIAFAASTPLSISATFVQDSFGFRVASLAPLAPAPVPALSARGEVALAVLLALAAVAHLARGRAMPNE